MRVKRSNLPAAVLFYIGLILSVTAIVVVLVNIYQRRARASRAQHEEEKKEKQNEDSIKTKRELLKKTTMVIEEQDFVRIEVAMKKHMREDVDLEAGGHSMEEEPHLGDTSSRVSDMSILHLMDEYKERGERPPVLFWVSTHCAICLGEYEPGDAVTWSTNPRCHHAYHNECLFSWFSKGHDTCPFCREEFCPKEHKQDENAERKAGENQNGMAAARSA